MGCRNRPYEVAITYVEVAFETCRCMPQELLTLVGRVDDVVVEAVQVKTWSTNTLQQVLRVRMQERMIVLEKRNITRSVEYPGLETTLVDEFVSPGIREQYVG